MAEPKAERTRDLGRIVVQRMIQSATIAYWEDASTVALPDTAEARAWIRDNGKEGETYRIARVHAPISLKVETVRKVVLSDG